MTTLTRKVKRETNAVVHEARRVRSIIVELEPPGRVIGFRAKGTRTTYTLPIDWCYRQAVLAHVEAARRAKREAKKKASQ
jgi:hypothetical protein